MREPTTRRILIEQAEQRRKDKLEQWPKWLRICESHLADGFSKSEIAARLQVSDNTVRKLVEELQKGNPQ